MMTLRLSQNFSFWESNLGIKKTPREKEVRKPGRLPDNTEPEKQRL
jgi:hypothetical protein